MAPSRSCSNCSRKCMERFRGMACRSWSSDGTAGEDPEAAEARPEEKQEAVAAAIAAIEELNLLYKRN